MIHLRSRDAWIVVVASIAAVSGCAGRAPWQLAPMYPAMATPPSYTPGANPAVQPSGTSSPAVQEQIRGQNAGHPGYGNPVYGNAAYGNSQPPRYPIPKTYGAATYQGTANSYPAGAPYQRAYQAPTVQPTGQVQSQFQSGTAPAAGGQSGPSQPLNPSTPPITTYQPPAVQPGFQPNPQGVQVPPGTANGFIPPAIGGAPPPQIGISPGALPPGPPFAAPNAGPPVGSELGLPPNFADLDVMVEEARTGRFMFGVGVNSSAGVVGQIVLDERNFDITRVPTSLQDFANGTAFRGAGQGFRVEALPGDQVQRYMVSFTEPYLFDTPVSLSLSGFFFDRNFFDWDEQRFGGRASLGYRLTHDLSVSLGVRAEQVDIRNPRVLTEPQLNAVLGDNDVYAGQFTLTHDTRDMPFAPTEGHLIELSFQQVFGTFDYSRGDAEYRRYHLIFERPDGSGRHTFSYGMRAGISGSQTPIYDHYFAGGFSTLRGFDFRGASPVGNGGVILGGEFQLLGSVEYQFPLTADDMIKAVAFCDFGTVEPDVRLSGDTFRVAPGIGLRVNVPAMGPAPLAFDFAFPVSSAPTDDEEVFSFFIGFGRL